MASKPEEIFDLKKRTDRMPLLFLGHGSPMNAIEDNEFVAGFRKISTSLPKPTAILCISAHWFINGTHFTAQKLPPTIHDFYGFPKELYQVQYPAKGSPELAAVAGDLIKPVESHPDDQWGFDHGAWSVLKHLYPKADVPVVQMSIDYSLSPEDHYELAGRLSTLRDHGVLIVGSGNIIHNLRLVDFQGMNRPDNGYDWAREARDIVNKAILSGDHKPLTQYAAFGKAMNLAVPTPDHYLPLLYCLGLQRNDENPQLFNDKLVAGSLSMTSVLISKN